jgi:hypothetical protein
MSEPASIQKIRSSHVKNISAEQYAGYDGLIWFDNYTGELRIWDNNIPGGRLIYGNAANAVTNKLTNGVYEFVLDATGNVTAPGDMSAVGNVAASYFLGDGSQLTNLPQYGSNVEVQSQGTTLTTAVSTLNFTGYGSNVTNVGNVVTVEVTGLPSQTGQAQKFLQTDGTTPSWQFIAGVFGLWIDGGTAFNGGNCLVVDGGGA